MLLPSTFSRPNFPLSDKIVWVSQHVWKCKLCQPTGWNIETFHCFCCLVSVLLYAGISWDSRTCLQSHSCLLAHLQRELTMNLDSAKCVAELRKYYIALPWLHGHPFSWPSGQLAPIKTTTVWVNVHWYINAELAIGYFGFVVYRNLQAYNDPSQTVQQRLYLMLICVMYACIALLNSGMLLRSSDFIQSQRSQIRLVRNGKQWEDVHSHLQNVA